MAGHLSRYLSLVGILASCFIHGPLSAGGQPDCTVEANCQAFAQCFGANCGKAPSPTPVPSPALVPQPSPRPRPVPSPVPVPIPVPVPVYVPTPVAVSPSPKHRPSPTPVVHASPLPISAPTPSPSPRPPSSPPPTVAKSPAPAPRSAGPVAPVPLPPQSPTPTPAPGVTTPATAPSPASGPAPGPGQVIPYSSPPTSSKGTNTGVIAGAAVGGVAVAAAIAAVVAIRKRRQRIKSAAGAKLAAVAVHHADEISSPPASTGPYTLAASDSLLQYINSTLSAPTSPKPQGGANLASWELDFRELTMEAPIGQGSWGRVYRAKYHGTAVAVKILLDRVDGEGGLQASLLARGDPVMARLQQEAGIISALHHPNIVQFLGMTLVPAAMVSEYCARSSLFDVLQAGRASPAKAAELTWGRRIPIAIDAALGMVYLHTRSPPIIHRDLKSANLLVDSSWKAKVSDFGMSRVLEESSASTNTNATNPRWLAPEVLTGERAKLPADVYAFGVVLWELLTWAVPWGGAEATANPWAIVGSILQGGRPPVPPGEELPGPGSGKWAGLDAYLALMQRCWAQEPAERPTFQEVAAELSGLDPSA